MLSVDPKRILGRWRGGYALDLHTEGSTPTSEDEYGHSHFATQRTPVGELLYKLKYHQDISVVAELAETAAAFVALWIDTPDAIVVVPPSHDRKIQPVFEIARELGKLLKVAVYDDAVIRIKEIPELKNIFDRDQRASLLENAHSVDSSKISGKRILLFDDLYRSGASMNAIASMLYDEAGATEVFALTITKTRSNR
jgi:competence protein ComFC